VEKFDPDQPHADNTEQIIKLPKTRTAFAQAKPHNGMFLFGIEIATGKCEQVKFEVSSLPHKAKNKNPLPGKRFTEPLAEKSQLMIERTQINHRVTAKEGYWYVWAINTKSALKKFKKAF
jgi:hypothetical protein